MEANEEYFKKQLLDFFESQVSKTEIFLHRKKVRETKKKIDILNKGKNIPEKEARKLLGLNRDYKNLESLTLSVKEKALKEEIPKWLDEAAEKGLNINKGKETVKATHLLKFTHSSAPSFSLCVKDRNKYENFYLCTEAISDNLFDISHSNGNLITISKFFLIQMRDDLVVDWIINDRFEFLEVMDVEQARFDIWRKGLKNFVVEESVVNLARTKQIYFPFGEGYHLISPLFSSSLSEALNRRVKVYRNGKNYKDARVAKSRAKYSSELDISIPKTAIQHFGGEHPQNVSPLNFGRNGNSLLMSSRPPNWQTQQRPPLTQFAFWRTYSRAALPTVKRFVNYLKSVKDFNNIDVRNRRKRYTDELIERFILVGAEIRDLQMEAGWSAWSAISDAEKYWLDPNRSDADFLSAKENTDWVGELADQYAFWLNRQLRYYKLNVAAPEHSTWRKEAKNAMRESLEGFDL